MSERERMRKKQREQRDGWERRRGGTGREWECEREGEGLSYLFMCWIISF